MARYPAGHRSAVRESILRAAADLFRAGGYGATGVDKVMAAVGKTAGGFYAYFQSKELLLAETIHVAMAESKRLLVYDNDPDAPDERLSLYLRRYLSRQHRDLAERGCPLPALLPEVARSGAEPRKALQQEVDSFSAELASLLGRIHKRSGARDGRSVGDALVALSVGAIALARAASDKRRSDEILLHARQAAEALSGVPVVHAPGAHADGPMAGFDSARPAAQTSGRR
jgi:TetR/AcrR family transcriptional regulator, transcriptional repressor for nem operon